MLGFRRFAWVALAGVLVAGCSTPTSGSAQSVGSTVPVSFEADAGTVLVGKPDAKTTIEVYEDFLCPYCQRFEQTSADLVNGKLNEGSVKVRYHLLGLLDNNSRPAGYSTLAANAALTVAKLAPERFAAFHALLFGRQPAEGGPGYTEEQLVDFAKQAGVSDPKLAEAVKARSYAEKARANVELAQQDPKLQQKGQGGEMIFGTPTILVNDKIANWAKSDWLTAG
ncbi:hypothetical protein GCM10010174_10050 [Kutzneria viridogrisea]|uniref:Thioredoxin-like fold domain-containing protein n=1 Tax=Kutzneria albida DSM 43870 TaxID=1449976 RepID=W5WTB3_9PSEU|nr:hypothetical protein KALB_8037 [Kutzneria albida DSM 43870]